MRNEEPIIVAIWCLVYNHEPYLRDCLEGFLMQKTNFRFVAVVHDDVSSDKSANIIREYAEKYPDVIKPIFETENQWSKHDGSIERIMQDAIDAYGCKYVAMCEGDDYWIDQYKLQKQVDFLEAHPDFSMCFHRAEVKNDTNTNKIITCDSIDEREYFTNDIFPGWVIPTASVVYRKDMVEKYHPLKHQQWVKYGDIVLFMKCTHTGRVWGMKDVMSVYRMTNNGAVLSQGIDPKTQYKQTLHYRFLIENFPELDKRWPKAYIATYYYTQFRVSTRVKHKFISLARALYYSPKYVILKLLKMHPHGTY